MSTAPALMIDVAEVPAQVAHGDHLTELGELERYIVGVRALWIEMVRRAAFDWVLYRNSRKLTKRCLAADAFIWLFIETPGDARWQARIDNDGSPISSFCGICDALGLNPTTLRRGICCLTPAMIRSLGKLPLRNVRYDASAEAGHDDIENRMSCTIRIDKVLGEVQLGGTALGDADGLEY